MKTNDEPEYLPDPFRVKHRLALNDAVREVVRGRRSEKEAFSSLRLPYEDASQFQELLVSELSALSVFNCARFRLSMPDAQAWVDDGRPS